VTSTDNNIQQLMLVITSVAAAAGLSDTRRMYCPL